MFDYSKVKDPQYFKEGCVLNHSDHKFFRDKEEFQYEESSFYYSLNGIWKFHYAKNQKEMIPGFEKEDYSCKTWSDIRVPAHIQLEGYDRPQYVNIQYPWEGTDQIIPGEIPERFNPAASYVKYFYVPEKMKTEHIFLSLDGAESAAAIWLNGNFIGYHEDSFTPAQFELTPYLKLDKENKLAVQVYKWSSGSWCEDQDFFRFSGLYRDVYLYSEPSVHIKNLHIQGNPSGDLKQADFTVCMDVKGEGSVTVRLSDHDMVIYEETITAKSQITFSTVVEHPKLWSSESPYLYDCEIEVFDRDGILQEFINEKAGFRRFEIKDSVMYLNGKRIVFNGVNRHEFSSINGRNVSEEELKTDLCIMKQNNINAIRTSHYPNSSLLYHLCDIYGIYLIDEVNLETHGTWDQTPLETDCAHILPKDDLKWKDMLMERASSMYERDKNHPSILIWSCGNESYGGKILYDMSQFFREKDPSRKVHYEGIYNDRSYPLTSDLESQMYTPAAKIEAFLKNHREKPFICCEYAHAMGNSCGALYKYTELTEKEELYQGGFIWDYIDQTLTSKTRYGEEFQAYGGDFKDRPTDYSFSGNGIVYGASRMPSPKMQEVKFLYQNIQLCIEKTAVVIKNKNLFTNTSHWDCFVLLEKDGKKLERHKMETNVAPLSKDVYSLDLKEYKRPGEYVITVSFHLKEDEIWAEKGYEIAFGQYVYQIEEAAKCQNLTPPKIIRAKHNIGVYGEEFSAIFSLISGGLVSYKYGGVELLDEIPKPNFWRAPTENDYGCLMPARHAQWKTASLYISTKTQTEEQDYPELSPYILEEHKDHVDIIFKYHMPTIPSSSCDVKYSVYQDGKIQTQLHYQLVNELPDMPEFGMIFQIDADYNNVSWYGLGPEETYADRKKGGKLGIYQNQVMDNMAEYPVPQECGNKEEVRYIKITNSKGRGLIFESAKNETMSASVLPYTPHQIEEAKHFFELPRVYHSVIRVSKSQMGVGGDDTWGAKTHPEFRLPVKEELNFCFSFKGI